MSDERALIIYLSSHFISSLMLLVGFSLYCFISFMIYELIKKHSHAKKENLTNYNKVWKAVLYIIVLPFLLVVSYRLSRFIIFKLISGADFSIDFYPELMLKTWITFSAMFIISIYALIKQKDIKTPEKNIHKTYHI